LATVIFISYDKKDDVKKRQTAAILTVLDWPSRHIVSIFSGVICVTDKHSPQSTHTTLHQKHS